MIAMPAVVGIGGNVGDVAATIRAALGALDATDGIRVVAVSSLYRTAPVGGVEQADFLNAAALLGCGLDPVALLERLLEVEQLHGRTRDVQWGPRTLDILWYADMAIAAPGLTIPHPRLHERRFALQPLVEVAPTASDAHGTPYAEILPGLPLDGVTVVTAPSLVYDLS
jgi:2-amino-4-hydroxy-6-hydroxymethyldihydropteridine diphosphokinase